MNANWGTSWNRVNAVKWLLLPRDIYKSTKLTERLDITIGDLFKGVPDRLNREAVLTEHAESLKQNIQAIKGLMEDKSISSTQELPPSIWMRLMLELKLDMNVEAMPQHDAWHLQLKKKGEICLYKYRHPSNGGYVGPKFELDDLKNVRGFASKNLLKASRKNKSGWPYCYLWEVSRQHINRQHSQSTSSQPIPKLTSSQTHNVLESKTIENPSKPRKRRTIEDIKLSCGTGLVHELETCLSKEVRRKLSVLTEKGRNRRLYGCELSLDNLIVYLKKTYSSLEVCANSTLKSAIPAFVACPRGRPKGIIHRERTVARKKRR